MNNYLVQVRQMWLDFRATKGHSVEPSVSLVPVNDPTLLWINSGVATLKNTLTGLSSWKPTDYQCKSHPYQRYRKRREDYVTILCLKCLGNFSIGITSVTEAITWAWRTLDKSGVVDFPKDKLYMTYYPADTDSYNRWIEVGVEPKSLDPNRRQLLEIGAGPSGPDTEIFFDRGEAFDPENRYLPSCRRYRKRPLHRNLEHCLVTI